VVDAVAISPMRLVAAASAVSRMVGSSALAGRNSGLARTAGPSARNSESNLARSAIRASSRQWPRSVLANGLLSGSRHAAS
jgi:hypothetical protein